MKDTKPTRIYKYDFIRAFAIITVMMSHIFTMFADTPVEIGVKEYINTIFRFSVAIFIFLSGYFFKDIKDFSYIRKKFSKVLIPYLVISIPATLFLILKYKWGVGELPEIILSVLFGYKFGYYFVFLILILYLIGYLFNILNLTKRLNFLLILSLLIQIAWLFFDESFYNQFNLYHTNFFQFQLNEFIFYRVPFTWLFFFILGMWFKKYKVEKLFVSKFRSLVVFLLLSFGLYNLQVYLDIGDYTPYGSVVWSIASTSVIFLLMGLNNTKLKENKIVSYISKISYPLYLIHYFFIYFLIEFETAYKVDIPYEATLLIFPAILLISILIIEVLKVLLGKRAGIMLGSS